MQSILVFSLMVIALLLPIKSSFFVKGTPEASHKTSPGFKAAVAVIVLAVVPALWMWIRFRSYELTPDQLGQSMQLVAPPPPPAPTQAPPDR
jgi:membrane protein YdbS with pleckstrin-like domain